MPPFAYLLGKFNFATLRIVLKEAEFNDARMIIKEAVSLNYGNFIQGSLNFVIISITIIFFIEVLSIIRDKADDTDNKTVSTPKDIELLSEIRDLLKENKKD